MDAAKSVAPRPAGAFCARSLGALCRQSCAAGVAQGPGHTQVRRDAHGGRPLGGRKGAFMQGPPKFGGVLGNVLTEPGPSCRDRLWHRSRA